MPEITTPPLSDHAGTNGKSPADPDSLSLEAVALRLDFLDRVAVEGVVPKHLAERAHSLWANARQESENRLPRPVTTATEGGPIGFNWDRGEHHLEAEIPASGHVEWFYWNRTTDETWDEDQAGNDPFSSCLLKYIERIAMANHLE